MSKAKIEKVWLDDARVDQNGMGVLLDICLDNGACLLFPLDSKINEPFFGDILLGKYRDAPKADGGRIYWDNGASLTLEDIMTIVASERKIG